MKTDLLFKLIALCGVISVGPLCSRAEVPAPASDRPQRIFDAVREVVQATGALTGKTRRALDSTVLEDAVSTQDTSGG